MDGLTFLGSEILRLPRVRDTEDYLRYLQDLFEEFRRLINDVDGDDPLSDGIVENRAHSNDLCEKVSEAVQAYFDGHPQKAYALIDKALASIPHILGKFLREDDIAGSLRYLYRIRAEAAVDYVKHELFHIPFELRHKIKTQRFSIPGFPCLYLGGSLYVCWEELGRPAFDTIHAAQFCPTADAKLRVVNLAYRPQFLLHVLRSKPDIILDGAQLGILTSNIALWPLIAACHVKVKHRADAFKPEYIIPQILLQWVRTSGKFEGLCYSSTHIDDTFSRPFAQTNLAFPAREPCDSGHCPKLLADFELSEPLSWQLASVVRPSEWKNDSMRVEQGYKMLHSDFKYSDFRFRLLGGITCRYEDTVFYEMQFRLHCLKRSPLSTR
jgi:hypothetical protein